MTEASAADAALESVATAGGAALGDDAPAVRELVELTSPDSLPRSFGTAWSGTSRTNRQLERPEGAWNSRGSLWEALRFIRRFIQRFGVGTARPGHDVNIRRGSYRAGHDGAVLPSHLSQSPV